MGTRKNCLDEAVLTSTHNLSFEQNYEKYQSFLSENFQFLEMKCSIYLNRRVFVMNCVKHFPSLMASRVSYHQLLICDLPEISDVMQMLVSLDNFNSPLVYSETFICL